MKRIPLKKVALLPLIALSSLFIACDKEKDPVNNDPPVTGNLLYIINEGPFQTGTGTLTLYDYDNQSVTQEAYSKQNGSPIGNIFQSMYMTDEHAYLVANNSGIIRVTDTDLQLQRNLEDLISPRYVQGVSNGLIAISDWSDNVVAFYETANHTESFRVQAGSGPDRMHYDAANGLLWAINSGGFTRDSTVTVINVSGQTEAFTVQTADNPNSVVQDAAGRIWVLCGGYADWSDPSLNTAGALMCFDRTDGSLIQRLDFPNTQVRPGRLHIDPNGGMLHYLAENKVYSMSTADTVLPQSALISGNSFYALFVHPENGDIFLSDAKDFAQSGRVYHYSPSGSLKNSFAAGVIPGNFYFP